MRLITTAITKIMGAFHCSWHHLQRLASLCRAMMCLLPSKRSNGLVGFLPLLRGTSSLSVMGIIAEAFSTNCPISLSLKSLRVNFLSAFTNLNMAKALLTEISVIQKEIFRPPLLESTVIKSIIGDPLIHLVTVVHVIIMYHGGLLLIPMSDIICCTTGCNKNHCFFPFLSCHIEH